MATLFEVKQEYGKNVFETKTSFCIPGLVSGILMVVTPKTLSMASIREILRFKENDEYVDSLNILFGGKTKVLFGEYFISQREGQCFRVNPKMHAPDAMILVETDNHNGIYRDEKEFEEYTKECGVTASWYGGKYSDTYDWWVVPMEYKNKIEDPEIDELPLIK